MKLPQIARSTLAVLVLLAYPSAAAAASGATLTPDRLSYMVNKDLGAERWTINLNLSADNPPEFLNASGNIFRADGGPPSFVLCQIRPDSTGTLTDSTSTFRFTCTGSNACLTDAQGCSQREWRAISDDVSVPAEFFLPAGDDGASGVLAARTSSSAAIRQQADSTRGSTLSSDGFNFLVNKDVGAERWSISLNLIPARTSNGSVETRINSVTGNVYKPDGSPPSFIYCTPRSDSAGSLADASSEFRFTCQGAGACTTTASDCSQNAWGPIAGGDLVVLSAGFFLPPGGLPDLTFSDPEIVVIGRTSDPPSIVSPEYRLVGESSSRLDVPLGGTCALGEVGQACLVPQLGGCADVAGTIVFVGLCGCQVTDVPSTCITCGSGATGACGGACEYPVGTAGLEARGVCLPIASDGADCQCYAVPTGGDLPVPDGCCGTLDGTCPAGLSCADDPRDGCSSPSGGLSCPGLCVDSGGCDPGIEPCGVCTGPVCGNGRRDPSELCEGNDLGGATCGSVIPNSTGVLACTPSCTLDTSDCEVIPCGNGLIDPGEECDGSLLGGESCASRGFCGGQLACTPDCRFDDQACDAAGLPNGTACEASACCTSGVCAATRDDPETRTCITCPKLDEECAEAACCDPFDQLECQPASGSSFCCISSQFACADSAECCSGQCLAGVCQ